MRQHRITPDLRAQLQEFYDDYAACADDFDLDAWPAFFSENCRYQVIAAENYDAGLPHATIWCEGIAMIIDRGAAIQKSSVFEPRRQKTCISSIRPQRLDGDRLHVQANFLIIESLLDTAPHISMIGRSYDVLDVSGANGTAGLRFQERICVYDNHAIKTSLIYPV